MRMKKLMVLVSTLLMSSFVLAETAGSGAAPDESKAPSVADSVKAPGKEAICRACHGEKGAAPIAPNYPKLNGQNKEYLVSSLKAYKTNERKGGLAALMASQASMLSDADMEELAAYYSAQK